jgi:hypothetical protein
LEDYLAVTPALRTYLELERLMLLLDEDDNSTAADALRDVMDPLWYSLNEDDRRFLDDRTIGRIRSLEEIRVPVSDDIFGDPPPTPRVNRFPPDAIIGWELAAA